MKEPIYKIHVLNTADVLMPGMFCASLVYK